MTTKPPHCCFVDPAGSQSCSKPAEFEIKNTSAGADPYDGTHACETHVGALLGGTNPGANQWAVWDISESQAAVA